jgi:hypothetical protein
VDIRTHRTKFLAGVGAACLALSTFAPAAAQSGPTLGSWLAGPGASGTSTIIGRIEAPRARQNLNSGASVLVTGWAADTTAAGWAGISGVEVWNGAKDKSGTKVATGTVGLTRADVGDALGGSFTNSGFSAVIPSSAWKDQKGAQALFVYLLTPGKGSYYRELSVNLTTAPVLAFPSDPIVTIVKPQDGTAITQRQKNSKFTFVGFALDRNPVADTNTLTGPGCSGCTLFNTQARGAGISNIVANIDTPTAQKGDNSVFGNFGTACGSSCLYTQALVSNLGSLNVPGKPQASIVTRQYGSQYDFSGWSLSINPALLSPGPHTLYVTATSSITGKQSTASVAFNVLDMNHLKIQP